MRARLVMATALAVGALVGCQSDITGTPVTSPDSPTEPSMPTPRPTRTPTAAPAPSTPAPPPSPSSPVAPAPAEALAPQNGWVFIQTKSGKTRCQLSTDEVGCEAPFTSAPVIDGIPATGVRLTAAGDLEWVVGNLGDIPAITLDYRVYSAVGWTIDAGEDGTRFTNDRTRHGMVVSIESVETF
ncbi:hypothetical protein JRC04_28020 [Mycolicibacterium sp. S2-37]|uniref:hypothetical protein n=1 Tax=Mycolicibacterium sp. S2-37 TaxID=2810297 RepID=UPI001A941444|nr:hypothetical protein [Mycolicibacterium sp. S2-37]MBO0681327.1 hypothetical protein [Mycolicibacterium sp. S2-37]